MSVTISRVLENKLLTQAYGLPFPEGRSQWM